MRGDKRAMANIGLGVSPSNVTGSTSFGLGELIKKIQNWSILKKSQIINLQFVPPTSSSIEMTSSSKYRYGFYVFQSLSFQGQFGADPDVFLIYSEDDSKISFDSQSQALYGEGLSVNRLEKVGLSKDKYEYRLSKQMCYYSDNDSEYDVRPFIIVIIGEESIGLATITVINKSFSKRISNGIVESRFPFSGQNPFIPQARKLVWPNGKDLLKKLHEPQTGRVFYLDNEDIEIVLELKRYFINMLPSKKQQAYSAKYIG